MHLGLLFLEVHIIISMSQVGFSLLYNWSLNASAKMDYVEQALLIQKLQDSLRCRIMEILGTFGTDEMDPLALKYTTILYLRLMKLNQQNMAKADEQEASDALTTGYLNKLYAISDYDLTHDLYAERITADSVEYTEVIDADPGSDVDIEVIKLYNTLCDFLGESPDKVKEYYGNPGSAYVGGLADCCFSLPYDIGSLTLIFAGMNSQDKVDEIQVLFMGSEATEVTICPGVTTCMSYGQIVDGLTAYKLETDPNGGEWIRAASDEITLYFSWNGTGSARPSFIRLGLNQ